MITAQVLAREAGAITGLQTQITRVSQPEDAGPDSVVFAQDEASLRSALECSAGMIYCPAALPGFPDQPKDERLVPVRDAKYAFALAARALRSASDMPWVHPSALVHETAILGEGTRVGAGAVLEAGAVIGSDARIGSRAVVHVGVRLGDRVVVQAGAILGSFGFGYVREPAGDEYLLFPQQGALVIEDDVEIGANTTIDRGALGETRIGCGTKIDNLVHIAHNCRIGRNVLIAAQVGISGSCVVEDGAILAGQVGISDHCHIGAGVILGGQAGVYRGKSVEGPGELFAGTPAEPIREHMKALARLRRLK